LDCNAVMTAFFLAGGIVCVEELIVTLVSHRDLIVWQKAMRLAAASYGITRVLPNEERFGLSPQIRRAAISVAANIAEGKGRRTKAEFAHFIAVARGSARELETLLGLAVLCGMVTEAAAADAKQLADEVIRMLSVLLRKLAPP